MSRFLESRPLVDRIEAHFAERFGPWAVEVKGGEPFIGFIGLAHVGFDAHFTPAIEILSKTGAEA